MITLEENCLLFRFPQVHEDAKTEIHFQRTLRIPDDGRTYPLPPDAAVPAAPRAMGLAAGGRMSQQICADPHGFDAWDQSVSHRCFVALIDAVQWSRITGAVQPTMPPTAADYTNAGLPWFDYYAADLETLGGAPELALVRSVAEVAAEKGEQPFAPDGEVNPTAVIALAPDKPQRPGPRPVREGKA